MIVTDYKQFAEVADHNKKTIMRNISGDAAPVVTEASDINLSRRRLYTGEKWYGGLSASGTAKIMDHTMLRRNTRDMQFDSVQGRSITNRMVDTVIDTGLVFDPEPVASILGISEEEAEQWGEDIGARFHLYMNSKHATLSETMTGYQAQWLAGLYQQRDNDFFVRFNYSPRPDLISPLQINLIDPDDLVGLSYTNTDGIQNNTADGIERDRNGKETAYWVRQLTTRGVYKDVRVPAVVNGTSRRNMIHVYRPEFAGQGRGFSLDAHIIQNTELLEDFELSHIKKAIIQAGQTLYVKPSQDSPASNPFENQLGRKSGPTSDLTTGSGVPDVIDNTNDQVRFYDLPEAAQTRPGSVGVFDLMGGEDLKAFDQSTPIESYDRFVDSFTAYLSASRGMPIEVLLMRFNENYSASRATLVLFWRIANMWRQNLVAGMLHAWFESWLAEEIASGRASAPGWSDPRMRAAWLSGQWKGSPMPDIDPKAHSIAQKNWAELGATHLDEIAQQRGGTLSSGKSNRAKLTRQYGELPIPYWAQKPEGGPQNG